MLESFTRERIETENAEIAVRHAGDGPPLVLLHGHPQTGLMWKDVAPHFTDDYTVIVPDLRGYGESTGPRPFETEHYAKREMAKDVVEVAAELGFDEFQVAGHDRGARVTYRLALDHPDRVKRLAVLDIIPTLEYYERATWRQSMKIWVWFMYPQPYPYPETLIGAAPDFHLEWLLGEWSDGDLEEVFGEEPLEVYRECMRDDDTLRAMMEDYRAGFHYDTQFDMEDRKAGNVIECPSLALYAEGKSGADPGPDPIEVWEDWTTDVRAETIDSSHFFPEEKPEATAAALDSFFVPE